MRLAIAAALVFLVSSDVVWAEEPKANVAVKAPTQIGDYWHYDVRDEITGNVKKIDFIVTDTTPEAVAVRADIEGKSGSPPSMTYDSHWSLIRSGRWRYLPSDGTGIPQRLIVGESWSFQGDSIDSESHHARRRLLTSKSLDREVMTTKAGTFDTYRIETSWNAHDTQDPTLRFDYVLTTWYAPAVNHWIKRTRTFRTDGLVREQATETLTAWGHGQNK
jgi:hypothetical protein